jgi:hypothetical protein
MKNGGDGARRINKFTINKITVWQKVF